MTAPSDLAQAAAELYRGPLGEFVATRNARAKALRSAGQRELAAAVASLPKPSASAWACDQLWWSERAIVDELFTAAIALRQALHAGDVGGRRGPTQRYRDAVATAAARAGARLAASGANVSPALQRRIAATLEALATAGAWPEPGPGCLAIDLDPPGFEALGAAPVVEPVAAEPPLAAANAIADARVQAIVRAREQLASARAGVEQRDQACEHARVALVRASDEHTAQRARLAEVERRVALAEAACAGASEELAAREREAELARAALAHAEAELHALERGDGSLSTR